MREHRGEEMMVGGAQLHALLLLFTLECSDEHYILQGATNRRRVQRCIPGLDDFRLVARENQSTVI